ncbi:pollen-specific leucine-rich repeat extensin-like protein 1 [Pyrus ussuriensis x Pyrus communis]|uniref:Pollen-specific leucine-rich repeat extensin-like protein 1 n=1 Tax=Pyrus ussuriensis x Pyrus communis TaxID=2448454 RepID=A0A5N5ICW6_9ROSA|nr:pollen-specific leucine-rich repeat extensin-like protein 1 [Pyrus ussuriensis x Pyrus communis]
MGEKEKVTTMVLKVDLGCHKCYKKVKKVLCKFPQIRDQIYDEKENRVVIKVVCCSPEKIRDKICCKGGGAIKSIEIKEPEKPKPPPPEKPKPPPPAEKPKPPPPEKPKEPEKPKPPKPPAEPNEPVKPERPIEPGKPYIQYDGYYGRPVYDSYGGGNMSYCVTRPDCFSEENPSACTIM